MYASQALHTRRVVVLSAAVLGVAVLLGVALAFKSSDSAPWRLAGLLLGVLAIAECARRFLEPAHGVAMVPPEDDDAEPPQVPDEDEGADAVSRGNVVAFHDPFVRHRARVRSLRVLVADPDLARRAMLVGLLERAGHRTVEAGDGEDALERLELERFDLAILDWSLPHFTGMDVLRQLRYLEGGRGAPTPVIMLAPEAAMRESAPELKHDGATTLLPVPIEVGALLAAIAAFAPPGRGRPAVAAPRPRLGTPALDGLAGIPLTKGFLRAFVDQCIEDAATCLLQLREQMAARDWEACRETAHGLRGIANNLGALPVSERCTQIVDASDAILARDLERLLAEIEAQGRVMADKARRQALMLSQAPAADEDSAPGSEPA